jgi:hypothetical protein
MAHHPRSRNQLACFLSDIQDWDSALDNALQGLPVPISGPSAHGISLQDAIKVKTFLAVSS